MSRCGVCSLKAVAYRLAIDLSYLMYMHIHYVVFCVGRLLLKNAVHTINEWHDCLLSE